MKKRILSVLIAAVLVLCAIPAPAFAASPVQITTAQQLQNINNNVAGSYILMNDIDLAGVDFTPIGNADSGAFSGVFDGNGKTIKNLNVFSGKYAGLFGCNEGTVKNLTLENIYVYGTRYVGGAVGENTALGTVENCAVLSGIVESDGGLMQVYGGGIVAINHGIMTGPFCNKASIDISSSNSYVYAGGICGYSSSVINLIGCSNYGTVSSKTARRSCAYSAGLIAYCQSVVKLQNCFNTGTIKAIDNQGLNASGGLVGKIQNDTLISSCYNSGLVQNGAGILGTCSRNDANKKYTCTIINCFNTGNYGWTPYAVGGAWTSYIYYTAGSVLGTSESSMYVYTNIINCYNVGSVLNTKIEYSGEPYPSKDTFGLISGTTNCSIRNCYSSLTCKRTTTEYHGSDGIVLYDDMLKTAASFDGWDFDNIWAIDESINSGYPTLRQLNPGFWLNYGNISDAVGKQFKLRAFNNGQEYGDIKWSVLFGSSTITKDGIVMINEGPSTISACDSNGNVAVCNVYGRSTSIEMQEAVTINRGASIKIPMVVYSVSQNNTLTWETSDSQTVSVSTNGEVYGESIGSATVTCSLTTGETAQCIVYVKAPVTAMEFEKKSMTLYVGDKGTVRLIRDPADTTDSISYSSSSTSCVSVNSTTGEFTAKAVGTATITATASSGVKANCVIIVKSIPTIVTSLTLDQSTHDMLVGEAFRLTATVSPDNATDKTVTWASTDESVATVTNGGTVEAVGAGKALITCESSNGIIAYCTVNVTGVASTNLSRIYVPDVVSAGEDTIRVPVMIEKNPGISYASLTVTYDGDKLEAQSVENGTVFNSCLGDVLAGEQKVKLYFVSDADVTANGALAFITFKVLDDASDASIKVGYFPSEIRNSSAKLVAFNLRDGSMKAKIACSHSQTELRGQKDASCKGSGYTGDVYCLICGSLIEKGNVTDKLAHTSVAVPGKAASCKETGLTDGEKCSVCGEVLKAQEEIPATGHKAVKIAGKAATCTEKGLTDGEKCSVCGAVITTQKEIPATGHKAIKVVGKAATCTEKGLTDGEKCSVCGTVITAQKEIPATGHKAVKVTGKAATCTEKGLTDGEKCSVCGEILNAQEEIPATGHKFETLPGKAPNCTDTGLTEGTKCSVCGAVLSEQETIAALGHTTPNAEGKCARCGEQLTAPPTDRQVLEQGYCGDDVQYTLYDDGWLVISGAGPMFDYENNEYETSPFAKEGRIRHVDICSGVTSVGSRSFVSCTNLENVLMADTVETIGQDAFTGSGLTSIQLGSGVTTVDMYAFSNCQSLKDVTIPASLKSIGAGAFYNASVNNVYIEDLSVWENTVFGDDTASPLHGAALVLNGKPVTKITVGADASAISDCFRGCSSIESVVFEDGVTALSNCGLANCTNLKQVTIPDSVETISEDFFTGCASLTDIYYTGTTDQWNMITGSSGISESIRVHIKDTDAPHVHTWNDGIVIKEPTCTDQGMTQYICTGCGETRTDPIPETGHKAEAIPGKAATCTEAGLTDGSKCSVCGVIFKAQEDVPALGHTTPNEDGKCGRCGEQIAEPNPPMHTHTTDVIPGKAATCTETGLTEGEVCSVCGEILKAQEEIPALGHKAEAVPGKIATCTETGLTDGEKCSVCGEVLKAQEEIPAVGHKAETIAGKAATCTEAGLTEGSKCAVCGEILKAQEEIPALGHKAEAVPGKAATCTETGLTDGEKCSVCGEILKAQETVPAPGHTAPNADGKCDRCGKQIAEPVPKGLRGDANLDGKVLANDARLVLRASAKLETLEGQAFVNCDLNGDGKLLAGEARKILRYSAKLEKEI